LDLASENLGIEGLVITEISFAYFGGKRKEEGEEKDLTQRTQRKKTEDTEKREFGPRS
jgi:hypothetical protein